MLYEQPPAVADKFGVEQVRRGQIDRHRELQPRLGASHLLRQKLSAATVRCRVSNARALSVSTLKTPRVIGGNRLQPGGAAGDQRSRVGSDVADAVLIEAKDR